MNRDDLACGLCGDADGALFLHARCHLTAPLIARKEDDWLILSCYLPTCGREVARLRLRSAGWSSAFYASSGEEFEVLYMGTKTFKVPSAPGDEFVVDMESGYGSQIKLNGVLLPSVEHIRIHQPVEGPLRVTVTFLAKHVTEARPDP